MEGYEVNLLHFLQSASWRIRMSNGSRRRERRKQYRDAFRRLRLRRSQTAPCPVMEQLSIFEAAEKESSPQPIESMTPDSVELRKARGAFFTPPEMVSFITNWAIRSPNDSVLEPSCGEAAFLLGAGDRLRALGAEALAGGAQLNGVELHAPSARAARQLLLQRGFRAGIQVSDFFDVEQLGRYDAVVGNPPYVRYQDFTGRDRAKGLRAALRQGVRLTGLSNSWAAFVVHASQFLKPNGRLGLVLPAELLSVNYAAQVRRFLLDRFASVRLVMFDELVFPGVLEEVVLLLAEGRGSAPSFQIRQARNLASLRDVESQEWLGFTPGRDGKWTQALLSAGAVDTFLELKGGDGFSPLLKWGDTSLGAVTGNNHYFALTAADAAANRIPARELIPISPPGSRHLRGLTFSEYSWEEQATSGASCYLFAPDALNPSKAALAYIARGEATGVQKAYKCRMRRPWWRVPLVKVPDLLLTYMDHERPRLVANEARIVHLNSLYGLTLRHGLKELGRDLLPLAVLNSVTMLAAEVVGRAYGGGLLKLEPNEADLWAVPSEILVRDAEKGLRNLRPQLATALRSNNLQGAIKLVDRELLSKQLGISHESLSSLRAARAALFARRVARGRGIRGEN
jgi:adenine-specific DNA-methyltransferase